MEKGRNKKIYSITNAGKQAFFQWMLGDVPVNRLETTALSKLYFLGLIEDVSQKKLIIQGIIHKIDHLQEQLNSLNETLSQASIPPRFKGSSDIR